MTQVEDTAGVPDRQITVMADGRLHAAAPAKINLNLLVDPVRKDGFHGVDSYVAKLSFHDTLTLSPRDDGRIRLECHGFDCGPAEQNLALRAAKALAALGDAPGADIDLVKRIAPGKGLGGGSSDAAAVLASLNVLWQLDLPTSELARIGASLGSDVPLFLGPPAARMTGRGECVEPIYIHEFWTVLCLPDVFCGTTEVYRSFDDSPPEKIEQFDAGLLTRPPSTWRHLLANQLAPPARRVCPALGEISVGITARISQPLHLTGSGSAMFVLCDSQAEADDVTERLSDVSCQTLIASVNSW